MSGSSDVQSQRNPYDSHADHRDNRSETGHDSPSIRALAGELQVSVITTKRAYEELEKEGLIRSVAGKGFYVCEYNKDYLKEKQLMMLESRLTEIIFECKAAGLTNEYILEMVEALLEEK